mgnify:CR=1 FL=1
MSHSFSVSNISNLPVQATISNLGISNLTFTDDSPQPQNNTWPNDESYLYIDDVSVRPVETSFSDGTFTARVFANSSPQDYELAIKLVTEIASSNNTSIQPEGDVDMDVESFIRNYDQNWIEEHCNTMFQMLAGTITHHQSTATLSGTRRELHAGPKLLGQLLKHPDSAATELHERFRTLNYLENRNVYIASGITLNNQEKDKEVDMSVFGPDVNTVLSTSVDAISLRINDDDMIFVTLDQLADALGDRGKWLSEHILLAPAIVGNEWDALIASLKPVAQDLFDFAHAVDPNRLAASDNETIDDYKALFSEDEWRNLLYTPVVVFGIVAGADGSIDKKEIKQFQDELIKGIVVDNRFMQQIMAEVLPVVPELLQDVVTVKVDPKDVLENITRAIDAKLPLKDAHEFKLALVMIGKEIAEASGGFLGMFGSKMSKEEEQALAAISLIIGLVPGHNPQ